MKKEFSLNRKLGDADYRDRLSFINKWQGKKKFGRIVETAANKEGQLCALYVLLLSITIAGGLIDSVASFLLSTPSFNFFQRFHEFYSAYLTMAIIKVHAAVGQNHCLVSVNDLTF